mgnify:CR=1 FL=1
MSKKIIVVDDSQTVRQQVALALGQGGYTVMEAVDGLDGFNTIQNNPDIALVICDVNMPRVNGLEMLEMLRKQPWGQEPSVIMLTARSQTQDIARANACGIDDYIIKPFDLSELLEKIESILEQRKVLTKASN